MIKNYGEYINDHCDIFDNSFEDDSPMPYGFGRHISENMVASHVPPTPPQWTVLVAGCLMYLVIALSKMS